MTVKKMTSQELADRHWNELESILLESMRMQMVLVKKSFIQGYEEGKKDGVRTNTTTK